MYINNECITLMDFSQSLFTNWNSKYNENMCNGAKNVPFINIK